VLVVRGQHAGGDQDPAHVADGLGVFDLVQTLMGHGDGAIAQRTQERPGGRAAGQCRTLSGRSAPSYGASSDLSCGRNEAAAGAVTRGRAPPAAGPAFVATPNRPAEPRTVHGKAARIGQGSAVRGSICPHPPHWSRRPRSCGSGAARPRRALARGHPPAQHAERDRTSLAGGTDRPLSGAVVHRAAAAAPHALATLAGSRLRHPPQMGWPHGSRAPTSRPCRIANKAGRFDGAGVVGRRPGDRARTRWRDCARKRRPGAHQPGGGPGPGGRRHAHVRATSPSGLFALHGSFRAF
jgi:hypothetical protein